MARLLVIIFFLASVGQAHGLTVTIGASAEVAEATVTLGDIATFDEESTFTGILASQSVAQAPAPGQAITLQMRPVLIQLSRLIDSNIHHVRWEGAATVNISRKATVVSSAEVIDIIDQFLVDNAHNLPKATIRFIPSAQPLAFSLPTGKLSWEVIPSNPEILGSSRFSVIFSVDGQVRRNMSVRGQIEAIAEVVAVNRDMARGSLLSAADLTLVKENIGNVREPLFAKREAAGKKLLVALRAGSPLSRHRLESPALVKKGQLVRMIFDSGGLLLSATGIARSDGAADETIRVQNSQSRKIVYCRVTAPGIVEVAR
ncbi:MAG: flagellar basal body P-ring formation chaperone FlgA [Desulfopila sp.]